MLCANCLCSWESVAMGVECLVKKINHDDGYALDGLLSTAPHQLEPSGWYRLESAVPI